MECRHLYTYELDACQNNALKFKAGVTMQNSTQDMQNFPTCSVFGVCGQKPSSFQFKPKHLIANKFCVPDGWSILGLINIRQKFRPIPIVWWLYRLLRKQESGAQLCACTSHLCTQ